MKLRILFCLLALVGGVASTPAAAYDTVSILQPWALATKAAQKTGAAYMELEASGAIAITKLESPAAQKVEIHTMSNENGVMKMRKLDRLDLVAGKPTKLAPGGTHIMLMGLKKPLKAGDTLLIKMTLQNANKKTSQMLVEASVRDKAPAAIQAKSK